MKYELTETCVIATDNDGKVWCIPLDTANSDYQRYLNPEAALSTPIVVEHLTDGLSK